MRPVWITVVVPKENHDTAPPTWPSATIVPESSSKIQPLKVEKSDRKATAMVYGIFTDR